MAYKYGEAKAHLDRLNQQKQLALAELQKHEKTLQAIRDAERELVNIRERQAFIAGEIREATAPNPKRLPPPIHGGREGLLAAVKEASAWDRLYNPKSRRKAA